MEEEVEVEVGSIYEIDHSKLPRNSPVQLNPIRVAMVLEKNDLTVSLRYPSMSSLQTHFNNHHGSSFSRPSSSSYRATTNSRMIIPALDEKYVMSSSFAGDVLYRKIPSQEWVERRQSWSFWVVPLPSMADASTQNTHIGDDVVLQKGKCSLLSELKSTSMVKWGKRQRVRFIGRHNSTGQNNNSNLHQNSDLHRQSSSHIAAIDGDDEKIEPTKEEEEEEEKEKIEPTEEEEEEEEKIEPTEDEEEEEIEKVEEDDELEKVGSRQIRKNRKRKCKTRQNQIQSQHRGYSHKKQRVQKTAINRWSEERFKLAEKSMLKVMKAKGAVAGSPILRLDLRQEARRYIGDTGLLDHLLKHMAGKVAPGGVERFRRRHNPEGAMEYWLESADLVRIRREAGVQDTYWIPPPGWKPGDNPSQDPILAMAMREIKEKMAQMERDMEELKSKRKEENQAIVTTPRSCIINQNMEDDSSSWLAAKEMCIEVVKRNGELEEQVMTLSQSLKKMEGEIVKLKCFSVKQASGCRHAGTEKEHKKGNHQKEFFKVEQEGDLQIVVAADTGKAKARSVRRPDQEEENAGTTTVAAAAAEKAAMVQRLKSSFRICRPQGTFLWPTDLAAASPSQSLVPTTPSSCLSSTTTTTFPLPPPPPLVLHEPPSPPHKPLAKKPPIIKIKLPNINTTTTDPTSHIGHGNCMKSTLLDLNNAPSDNLNDTGNCGTTTITSPTSRFCSSSSDDHHHHGRSNQLLPVTTNTGGSSSSLSLCAAADAWLALAAAPPNSDPIN